MDETVPVRFTVQGVEPVRAAGRLIALAIVALDVAGVELVLQGVQVVRGVDGVLTVRPPVWRHPASGRWLPAMVLPPELQAAIGVEVLSMGKGEGGG